MSIASELNALNGYILGAYDEINTKGGTVPANKNMANLASAIASIESGGGGGGMDLSNIFNGCQQFEVGTFRPSSSATRYTLSHSLGVAPCLILVLDPQSLNSWASDYSYTKVVFGMCYQDPNMTISGGAPSGTGFSLEKHVGHYRNSTSIMTGDYYMQASKGGSDSKFGDGLFSTTERANMCYNSNPSSVVLNFGSYYMMRTIEYNYILGAPNA